jgi:dihydroflavonol-4-reductase
MSRVLVTSGAGVVGGRLILRLLAAGRELRTMVGTATRTAEMRAILHTGNVQRGGRVSFIAADRDHEGGRLDAAAGCEFVDDRVRLRE